MSGFRKIIHSNSEECLFINTIYKMGFLLRSEMFSCKKYGLGFFVASDETFFFPSLNGTLSSVVLKGRLSIAHSAKHQVTVASLEPLLNCAHAQRKLQSSVISGYFSTIQH